MTFKRYEVEGIITITVKYSTSIDVANSVERDSPELVERFQEHVEEYYGDELSELLGNCDIETEITKI